MVVGYCAERGEIKQSQTLCAHGNWAVKRGSGADRSRFIDHRARLTHPRACAREINVGIYIYSIILLYADAVRLNV